jgi:hypothetical protein
MICPRFAATELGSPTNRNASGKVTSTTAPTNGPQRLPATPVCVSRELLGIPCGDQANRLVAEGADQLMPDFSDEREFFNALDRFLSVPV